MSHHGAENCLQILLPRFLDSNDKVIYVNPVTSVVPKIYFNNIRV